MDNKERAKNVHRFTRWQMDKLHGDVTSRMRRPTKKIVAIKPSKSLLSLFSTNSVTMPSSSDSFLHRSSAFWVSEFFVLCAIQLLLSIYLIYKFKFKNTFAMP